MLYSENDLSVRLGDIQIRPGMRVYPIFWMECESSGDPDQFRVVDLNRLFDHSRNERLVTTRSTAELYYYINDATIDEIKFSRFEMLSIGVGVDYTSKTRKTDGYKHRVVSFDVSDFGSTIFFDKESAMKQIDKLKADMDLVRKSDLVDYIWRVKSGTYHMAGDLETLSDRLIRALRSSTCKLSDGYHTFDELYEHRTALLAALVKNNPLAYKSKKHHDGSMYDNMFIVGINYDKPITYHCEMEYWDKFQCKEVENAPEWDGHTPDDVVQRLFEVATSE